MLHDDSDGGALDSTHSVYDREKRRSRLRPTTLASNEGKATDEEEL